MEGRGLGAWILCMAADGNKGGEPGTAYLERQRGERREEGGKAREHLPMVEGSRIGLMVVDDKGEREGRGSYIRRG